MEAFSFDEMVHGNTLNDNKNKQLLNRYTQNKKDNRFVLQINLIIIYTFKKKYFPKVLDYLREKKTTFKRIENVKLF